MSGKIEIDDATFDEHVKAAESGPGRLLGRMVWAVQDDRAGTGGDRRGAGGQDRSAS